MKRRESAFIKIVYNFYYTNQRNYLPWRRTFHPYDVLVSEFMLQQTQVDRVIPKYQDFMFRFPDIKTLAAAPLSDVLQLWQGLGYNRRAKLLHSCANIVSESYGGVLPEQRLLLESLPGIGPYTAGAIMVFAYNKPEVVIETNIRTVYLHHFFQPSATVSDTELRPVIERTIDTDNPRDWYAALMDYGSYLKQTVGNNIRYSREYKKQPPFKGSVREVRGAVVRTLSYESPITRTALRTALCQFDDSRFDQAIAGLLLDGLISESGNYISLPCVNK